jgi:hypothetical protein
MPTRTWCGNALSKSPEFSCDSSSTYKVNSLGYGSSIGKYSLCEVVLLVALVLTTSSIKRAKRLDGIDSGGSIKSLKRQLWCKILHWDSKTSNYYYSSTSCRRATFLRFFNST